MQSLFELDWLWYLCMNQITSASIDCIHGRVTSQEKDGWIRTSRALNVGCEYSSLDLDNASKQQWKAWSNSIGSHEAILDEAATEDQTALRKEGYNKVKVTPHSSSRERAAPLLPASWYLPRKNVRQITVGLTQFNNRWSALTCDEFRQARWGSLSGFYRDWLVNGVIPKVEGHLCSLNLWRRGKILDDVGWCVLS